MIVVGLVLMVCGVGMMAAGWRILTATSVPPIEAQMAAWAAGLDRGLTAVRAQRRRRSPAPWASWAVR